MKNIKRILSFVLALVLACGALSGVQLPRARGAAQTYNLAQLLNAGAIKALGRAMVADGKVLTVWSGTGFEMNVFAPAETTLTVGYESTYSCYWAVLVDGAQVARVSVARGTGTFSAAIPYGSHTVSVVQETQIDKSSTTATCFLTTMSMGATLQAAPAEKDLYIEFIGDSYSCGSGTLVDYQTGVNDFSNNGHSATHGFPWYTAKALNADYSIVARGGIGMFVAASAQEGTPNSKNITEIYQYNAGYNTAYGEYSGGKADIVVIYIGANDTINSTNNIGVWKSKLVELVTLAQKKNPDAAVVCMSSEDSKYHAMKELAESGEYGEIYAFFCGHHGNGGAALNYQMEGHPSAADSEQLAKELVNFMRYNEVLPQPETKDQTVTYNDIVYYVAEGGSDSNDGKSIDKAKLTLNSALKHAKNNNTLTAGDRVVVKISGAVLGADAQSLGYALTDSAGGKVPVLITTHNYDAQQSNKATLQVKYSGATVKGQCSMAIQNDLTLQNLRLETITNANGWAPFNLFAAGYDVVFDNVTFANDGKATTVEAWNIGCVNFMDGNNIENAKTTPMYGSVTFLNGDYTNLGTVAAVFQEFVWKSGGNIYALPYYHAKLVIGEGAKMGTIYGRYGKLQVGSVTVEINGGEVAGYMGTRSGTSGQARDHYGYENGSPDVETDLNLVINGGEIKSLAVTGNYVKLKGDVSIAVNAGTWAKNPTVGSNVELVGDLNNVVGGGTVTSFVGTNDTLNLAGSVNNTINGGTIGSFVGTGAITAVSGVANTVSGGTVEAFTGTASSLTLTGNIVNNIDGGVIHGFMGTGSGVNVTGNVDLNMTGGRIEVQHSAAAHSVYLSGDGTVNGNVTNTISGGEIHVYNQSTAETLIVFGGNTLTVNGVLHNKISGGTFAIFQGDTTPTTAITRQVYFGSVSSPKTTLLKNELTGGTFYIYSYKYKNANGADTTSAGVLFMGGRALKSVFGKVENILGVKDRPSKAPRFLNANLNMGGNWAQIGSDTYFSTAATQPTTVSDTVVLSNTIYGGYFGGQVAGAHSSASNGSNYFEYIKGSIENNIYDGFFTGTYYGGPGGGGIVLGKVTNNIYGGRFADFYGAGSKAIIKDGVETNIYGMEDYQLCANNKSQNPTIYVFDVGNRSGGSITATTAGRPAVKLVIDAKKPEDVAIYKTMTLTATEATGTKVVEIKSGTFPTGLKLTGAAVEDVLAKGSYCFVDDEKVTPAAGVTSVSGAVVVKAVPAMIGDTIYESVEEALTNASAGQAVQLGKNAAVEMLRISATKKLDINGNTLTAADLLSFGHFVDTSNGKGILKISNDPEQAALVLRSDNEQIPLYDTANGGYRFYNRVNGSISSKEVNSVTRKFGFRLILPSAADYALLQDAEAAGVSVELTVKVGNRLNLSYAYTPELVQTYANGVIEQLNKGEQITKAFTITLTGLNSVKEGETVTVIPRVVTDAGVVMEMDPLTWTPAQ